MGILRSLRDRFIAWNHRPREMSAEEVAAILRKFLANTATHSEEDYFCTGPRLADPELDEIRAEADWLLGGPFAELERSEMLQALIARADAIAAR